MAKVLSMPPARYTLPPADNIRTYRDTPPPAPDWVVQGLEPGNVGVLSAAGGTGKSMLCLSLSLAVASAASLFGRWAVSDQPGDVLYLYAEDSGPVMHRRIHAMAQIASISDDVADRMHFVGVRGGTPKLMIQGNQGIADTQSDVIQALIDLLMTYSNPRLLILDPLVKFHALEENSNGQMNQLLDLVTKLSDAVGVATILTHHVSKVSVTAAGQSGLQQSARGASAIVDEARWLVSLTPLDAKSAKSYGIPAADAWRYLTATSPKVNGTGRLPDLLLERQPGSGVLLLSSHQPITAGAYNSGESECGHHEQEDIHDDADEQKIPDWLQ